jgi:hypothetical protein
LPLHKILFESAIAQPEFSKKQESVPMSSSLVCAQHVERFKTYIGLPFQRFKVVIPSG